jgi:hypothetical protein
MAGAIPIRPTEQELLLLQRLRADEMARFLTELDEHGWVLLAERRSGVMIAAGVLQKAGIISYVSGDITVLNRNALELSSCECYRTVKGQIDFILGKLS